MQTRLRLLLFVLAVPLLTALAASAARDRWDERWSAGLQREFRAFGHRPGVSVMAQYSLGVLCRDAGRAAGIPPCRTYNRLSNLVVSAGGVSAIGLAWIGLVAGAAAAARRSRRTAVAAFAPVVYVSAGLLVLLLAAQGLLAVNGASLAGSLLSSAAPLQMSGSAAGLAAALVIGLSSARAVRAARRLGSVPYVFARALRRDESPSLFAMVERLRGAAGERSTLDLMVGLPPAVFVVAGPVDSLDGRRAGPVLHFSLTLARILTLPECEALVAAQVSRLGGRQARSSARLASGWLRLHEEAGRLRSASALAKAAAFPARWWLDFVVESFEPAAAAAWRESDDTGDRAAVASAGGEAYGAALLKVHAFAPAWDTVLRAMADAAAAGEQYSSGVGVYEEVVAANADPARIEWAAARLAGVSGDGRLVVPRAGGADLAPVAAAALEVRPVPAASTLLGDAAARLDDDLTTARHLQLQ